MYKLGQQVQDKNEHKTIVIIGNEVTGLWKKAFGLALPEDLIKIVEEVMNDKGVAAKYAQEVQSLVHFNSSLCKLCVLCVSVVVFERVILTTEAQRTQSLHREIRALSQSERRGKEIYLRGTSPSGRELTGRIGEIDVPAATVTCAGCHGLRGEGKTEGGVTAGNLTWPHLVKPYGHTHPTGRRHGPFNESSFIRAVVNGIDSDGNNLLVAMPRYNMSAEDMADLIACSRSGRKRLRLG